MAEGYVYCFSCEAMPDLLKIGMTERTPDIRLNEANRSDTWRPPKPYKMEFAKKVINPKKKETTLHRLLSQYTERPNPKQEFFHVSVEEVKELFELMDGEWVEKFKEEEEEEYDEEDERTQIKTVKGCRDIDKCFINEQPIRHIIGINKKWIGKYDSNQNGIVCNGKIYLGCSPLNQFAKSHYVTERKDRVSNVNAWRECECEVNGKWISTFNLPLLKK